MDSFKNLLENSPKFMAFNNQEVGGCITLLSCPRPKGSGDSQQRTQTSDIVSQNESFLTSVAHSWCFATDT